MSMPDQIVYLVDDDFRVREALSDLLESEGLRVVSFESALRFLEAERPNIPSCLVLDLALPDLSGLDLQQQLGNTVKIPIIFITGHGDVASSVQAMKAGAIDFLTKPFADYELLSAVKLAIGKHGEQLNVESELSELRRRHNTLTAREKDVFPLVVSGLLNKQAASVLGISEVTLQIHRGNVMKKMAASSLAELVRIAEKLNVHS